MRASAGPAADAARPREAARASPPADARRRADRHRVDDRPLASEPDADDGPHALRPHGAQSIAIDQPPPSQEYKTRATTFDALVPLVESHFYSQGVQRRLLIVLTDGESSQISPLLKLTLHRRVAPVFVHVWEPGERIFNRGRADRRYVADPQSKRALDELAEITGSTALLRGGRLRRDRARGPRRRRARRHAYAHRLVCAHRPRTVVRARGRAAACFLLWRRNV